MALYTKYGTEKNDSGVTVDIHLCNTRMEALQAVKEQAERNADPGYEITFLDVKELDMEHLMKDWIDGKKTGKNYYKD